jgi:hypothetical protein
VDLYEFELADLNWIRLCGGNTGDQSGEETESCVEIAPIQGLTDVFALRDSKNPNAGTLRFTGHELASFADVFHRDNAA